jgi:hypothetical protein
MDDQTLFRSLDSLAMADFISRARIAVCYAAPGLRQKTADALAQTAQRIGPDLITVYLHFDERVMRMGYGELAAVETLRNAGIGVNSLSGLRTSLVIVDDEGYIFTPTALFLEAEDHASAAPNAMRLSKDQVKEALARVSPAAKELALLFAKTEEERERITHLAVELPSIEIADKDFMEVKKRLEEAPPVKFDVARQVRVFNAYLQYVELKLSGAAIQRRRIMIPKSIHRLGSSKEIEARLKTTFDLIEKGGILSSKGLEEELNEIRGNLTPSLGKNHGRAVLKKNKQLLEERLATFREKLEIHQKTVQKDLQAKLDASRDQIVEHYLPLVLASPPDKLRGRCGDVTKETARNWLLGELTKVFPTAEDLTETMKLEVHYKDVTFETLNEDGFLKAVEKSFDGVNWRIPYNEFKAAAETGRPSPLNVG